MQTVVKHSVVFLLYLFFQIFLFNHLTLFQIATPFVFVLFLFMLPLKTQTLLLYVIAFAAGLLVDFLSDTYANGLHALSCLAAIAIRKPLIRLITPTSYRNPGDLQIAEQSSIWFALYIVLLIFIHQFCYHMLEAFGFTNFLYTLLKTFAGTIYTFIICYSLSLIFYRK